MKGSFLAALVLILFFGSTRTLLQAAADSPTLLTPTTAKIEHVEVNPADQYETVMAIMPFQIGDVYDSKLLPISRRLLEATDKFDSEEVKWVSDEKTVVVNVHPKRYLEGVVWLGDSVHNSSAIERECFHPNESQDITQERLSQIDRCILENLQSRGFLDAQVSISVEGIHLQAQVILGTQYLVDAVNFVGNNHIESKELRSKLSNRVKKPFQPKQIDDDTKAILRLYLKRGYYLTEVTKPTVDIHPDVKKVRLVWNISESRRFDLQFRGDYRDKTPLDHLLEREETLPRYFVDEITDDMEGELKSKGYLRVRIKVNRHVKSNDVEVVEITTKDGPRYHLTEPEWIGASDKSALNSIYRKIKEIQPGQVFREDEYKKAIKEQFTRALAAHGYLDLRLGTIDFVTDDAKSLVRPIVYLSEGEVYLLQQTKWNGISPEIENLQEFKDLKKIFVVGKPFDSRSADDKQKQLQRALVALGYLDAKIERHLDKTAEGVNVMMGIDTGPRYRVAKVLIRGARKTKYLVLKREVLLNRGDYFDQERIKDSVSNILRLGIARNVDIKVLEKDVENGEVYVLVDVEEAARFRFEFGPGFGTVDGIRGTFRGTYANIGGTARSLSLYAKANRKLTEHLPQQVINPKEVPFIERHITVEYFEPSLFNFHIDGRLSYDHAKLDQIQFSTFSNTFTGSIDYRLTRHYIFTTHYDFQIEEPFNINVQNTQLLNTIDPHQKRLVDVGESVLATFLDDEFNPMSGIRSRTDGYLFDKRVGSEFSFWQATARDEIFFPLWVIRKSKWLGYSLSASAGFSSSYGRTTEVPVEKRYFVGGETSVRGFDEKSISPVAPCTNGLQGLCTIKNGGDSFFSFMSEINIPLFYGLDLLGFFDGGNAYNSNSDFRPWKLRYGAGPGIRWNTPVGPLKAGYGFILGRQLINGSREPLGTFYFGVGPI